MADEDKNEVLNLEERPDGTVVVNTNEAPTKEDAHPTEDDKNLAAGSEDDDHEQEEQASASETAEEAEARRQRNRERRAANKERRKEHIESLKRELAIRDQMLAEVNQRLAVVERKSTGAEMAQLDHYEREAKQVLDYYKQVNQEAIKNADGVAATEAQEKMFQARQRLEQIASIKKAVQAPQQTQTQTRLDPRLMSHANQWMQDNPWYSPTGTDMDSSLIRTIDNGLASEGWDPTTPEYWAELDARKKKYLPHRTNLRHNSGAGDSTPKRTSPVAAGGVAASSGKSAGEFVLSPERVQALKDAGMWDDPVKRTAMIKRYQQIDKEQRA